MEKNKIKNQIIEIKKRNLDICYSDFKTINENRSFFIKLNYQKN